MEVASPWARATAPGQANGAVYAELIDRDGSGDRLLSATAALAARVELHTHLRDGDGVMRMRPVEAIPVPPGGRAGLVPGGLHIMLLDLASPLREGSELPLTLVFARAGAVPVVARIAGAGAMAAPSATAATCCPP